MKYNFKDVTIVDENFNIAKNMNVVVKDDKIVYVGERSQLGGTTVNCKGKILMPGFYNAHSHLPMSIMRGYGEDMALKDWLTKKIFPYEAKLKNYNMYYATQIGIAEMLRNGIVSTTDMYFHLDELYKAFVDSGAKANLSNAIICGNNDTSYYKMPDYSKAVALTMQMVKSENTRVIQDLGIHAEYTTNESVVRDIIEFAKSGDIAYRLQLHVSETQNEVVTCKERHHGLTPVQYFYTCGLFDLPVTLAHCVWLEEKDYEILQRNNVFIATCPKSNLKLASGICNVMKLKQKGINVALGTDSVASNNNLNMFEEMRVMSLLQKVKNETPIAVPTKEILKSATYIGALSQGRKDCGLIKEGFKADLILVDIDRPWFNPTHDLMADLVYSVSGENVVMTMVDGKILYYDGEFPTIDIEKAVKEVNKLNDKILKELKPNVKK